MTVFNTIIRKYKELSLPIKAAGWFAVCNIVQKGIVILTTPIFTRLLSKEDYGQINIYNSWQGILLIIVTLCLTTSVIDKAMIKYKENRYSYLSSMLTLTSIITIIALAVGCFFRNTVESVMKMDFSFFVIMMVDVFFTSAVSFWTGKNKFEYNYIPVVVLTLFSNICGIGLSLFLIKQYPENAAFCRILGVALVHVVAYIPVFIYIFFKGKLFINLSYWKYSVVFSLPLIPHYLSQQVLNQADRLMINAYCGSADAALYSLAYQIAIAVRILIDAIFSSFTPWAFQNIESGDMKKIGDRAFQIEFVIGVICVMFALFAPEMVFVMGGNDYSSSNAMYAIPPVSMSVLFITIYSFFSNIEFYFEKTKFVMIASCTIAVSNLVLNAIFIPKYGYIAAAYTTLVCYILYALIHYLFMLFICKKENIENPFPFVKVWGIALVFAGVSLVISLLYQFRIIRYFIIFILLVISTIYAKKHSIIKLGKR